MATATSSTHPICVVTGGRGFVARHLVQKLLDLDTWRVRILDIAPELVLSEEEQKAGALPAALEAGRLEYVCADICYQEQVQKAFKGASVVFHMASPSSDNSKFSVQYAVNVAGTRNVVEACIKEGVSKLIFTSSASVVFSGMEDIKGGDESLPYALKPLNLYAETKAQAEAIVLSANGRAGLLTCSLRPSNVFGPGDLLLVPTTVKNAAGGRLKFIIGDGENKSDFTYVDNVVHAHICAERALEKIKGEEGSGDGKESPAGKAFFITNGEPRKFWDFIFSLVRPLGYPVNPRGKLPASLILPLSHLVESIVKLLAPLGIPPSDFTPARMRIATKWRVFSSARAERLLGYHPIVTVEEGIKRTVATYPHLKREVYLEQLAAERQRTLATSTHAALGGGNVADILLWRQPKQTLAILLLLLLLLRTFLSPSTRLVPFLANLAIFLLTALFIYPKVQPLAKKFGAPLPQLSSTSWTLPESSPQTILSLCREILSSTIKPLHQLIFVERDVTVAFIVVLFIYFLKKTMAGLTLRAIAIYGLFGLFVVPIIHEKFEGKAKGAFALVWQKLPQLEKELGKRVKLPFLKQE